MLDKPSQGFKEKVNTWLFNHTRGVVMTGPFAGMKMREDVGWESNSLAPMLLGSFEEELHEALEREITRLSGLPNPVIMNIGCSEGYYAIGLARRLPNATVIAVDISPVSLKIAADVAEENGVRLVVAGPQDVRATGFEGVDLVVMDCEGAEVDYLDFYKFPALKDTTIIVEIHNWPGHPRTDLLLQDRFKKTHHIDQIMEAGRNPNKFDILIQEPSVVRWAAVCEYRPCVMDWFVMRPIVEAVTPRSCGGCTLCCKVEKVVELDKPSNTVCGHCDVGTGCKIYNDRPTVCRTFACAWLTDLGMSEAWRPDRIHMYLAGDASNGYLRAAVDRDYPEAWVTGGGKAILEYVAGKGLHVIVHGGNRQVNFMKGEGVEAPRKIMLDWTL